MKISIFNYQLLSDHIEFRGISESKIISAIQNLFPEDSDTAVNIVFTSTEEIYKLNKEFRSKDEATDVLSFEAVGEGGVAEVYVSPQIILNRVSNSSYCTADAINARLFVKETFRITLHGILHILGYDHKEYYTGPLDCIAEDRIYDTMKGVEEMFIQQELLLSRLIQSLNLEE